MSGAMDKNLRMALALVEEVMDEIGAIEGAEINGGTWSRNDVDSMRFELHQIVRAIGYARQKLTTAGTKPHQK